MDIRHQLKSHPLYAPLLAWARDEAAIRALVITGSLARGDGSVDRFSDLDAQLICREITAYLADDSWLDGLGKVWIRFPRRGDAPYRLVWFAGGHKVDFQFRLAERVRAELEAGRLSDEYQRGYIVALDKDGLFRHLPPSPRIFPPPPQPDAEEILAAINEFWFEAIHVAQFIVRREFWVAKWRDWTMKRCLLRMLEWQAQARGEANTWLLGKRIEDWADESARSEIPAVWAAWQAQALWQALLAQVALFSRLSHDVCAAHGISRSRETEREIERYIRRLCADDQATAGG